MFLAYRLIAATAAAAMAATTVALPASATPAYETRIALVPTAGLDLTTPQGVAALNTRLHATVNALCGTPDMDDARSLAAIRQCRAGAMAATKPQMEAAIEKASRSAQAGAPAAVQLSSTER